ncbi:protein-S-isoprenylcysteine O-methyltransferase [Cryptococcus neoformans Ze90-1]|nr:protein-S-isoprenylcysteine O-methyltransferase [Cryptococcus neoformans var. grubii Ze90-1]
MHFPFLNILQRPTMSDQTSQGPLSLPKTDQYDPRGSIPNTVFAVALIAAVLGAVGGSSLALASQILLNVFAGSWARPQLGIYLGAMCIFHLMEFFTTAGWNPQKLSVDAFLLNNGRQYHYAHAIGLAEYFISSWLFPGKWNTFWGSFPWLTLVTLGMVVAQGIRSMAMIQAAQSFSHIVKSKKHDDHMLVTHGLYSWSRHPSYAGFFYWAVATQLLLGNIVSTLGFVIVLNKFFSARIVDEEKWLVKFFGNDYVEYRKRVGTKLLFYFSK